MRENPGDLPPPQQGKQDRRRAKGEQAKGHRQAKALGNAQPRENLRPTNRSQRHSLVFQHGKFPFPTGPNRMALAETRHRAGILYESRGFLQAGKVCEITRFATFCIATRRYRELRRQSIFHGRFFATPGSGPLKAIFQHAQEEAAPPCRRAPGTRPQGDRRARDHVCHAHAPELCFPRRQFRPGARLAGWLGAQTWPIGSTNGPAGFRIGNWRNCCFGWRAA